MNGSKLPNRLLTVNPRIVNTEDERMNTFGTGFKPIYKVAYPQFLRVTRQFNYSEKSLMPVSKKCHPVSRFTVFGICSYFILYTVHIYI